MRGAVYIVGPIVFLISALALIVILLEACAIFSNLFGYVPAFCAKPEPLPETKRLEREVARGKLLEAEIRRLERELLAKANCPIAPPATPEPQPPSDGIDRDLWEQGDLSVLEGCWELESDYQAKVIQTGQPFTITEWRACFDAEGNGTGQRFKASHGPVCSGPQRAEFDGNGSMIIRDLGNVPCTQNFRFLQRTITCTLNEDDRADCIATDTAGGASQIKLRRAR